MSLLEQAKKGGELFRVFLETARNEYSGPPLVRYFNFVYYTFFRVNVFNIYQYDLTRELPEGSPMEGFRVLQPTLDELEQLRVGKNLPREFYYDRTHGLSTCHIALQGEEVAYIQWICGAGDPSRFFRLGEGVVRITNVTTLPAFRGQQLMSRMFRHTLVELKQRGYKKVVSSIHSENIASIKSILKAGYRLIGTVRTVGRFSKKMTIS